MLFLPWKSVAWLEPSSFKQYVFGFLRVFKSLFKFIYKLYLGYYKAQQMLFESQAKSGSLHENVEMLLKLSDLVSVDGSSWIKNWLGVSKLILKDICVHGNFYKYLSSDIFTILNIKKYNYKWNSEKKSRGFFDCLKRINSTLRWKFEPGLTLSIQTEQFVSWSICFCLGVKVLPRRGSDCLTPLKKRNSQPEFQYL